MIATLRLRVTVLTYAVILRIVPSATSSHVTCDMALQRLLERLATADRATSLPPAVRPLVNHRTPR